MVFFSFVCGSVYGWMRSDPLVVAGIAAALIGSTYVLTGLPVSGTVLLGVPAGVALVYRFDRTSPAAVEDARTHGARRRWMDRHHVYIRFTTTLYVLLAVWAFWNLAPLTQAAAAGFAGMGALYVWPIRGWRFKHIGSAKTLAVAGAWSLGVVGLPVLEGVSTVGVAGSMWEALGLACYRMGWLLPNLLCSDWADRAADHAAGLETLPQSWSVRQVRTVAASCAGGAALAAAVLALTTGRPVWMAEALAAALLALGGARCPVHPGPTYRLALDLYMAVPGLIALLAVWVTG
ncbi:hypothetical protein [Longimonas halophila]|nr:hypothetical protein [Longimonas halophila]